MIVALEPITAAPFAVKSVSAVESLPSIKPPPSDSAETAVWRSEKDLTMKAPPALMTTPAAVTCGEAPSPLIAAFGSAPTNAWLLLVPSRLALTTAILIAPPLAFPVVADAFVIVVARIDTPPPTSTSEAAMYDLTVGFRWRSVSGAPTSIAPIEPPRADAVDFPSPD